MIEYDKNLMERSLFMPSIAVTIKPNIIKWLLKKVEMANIGGEVLDLLLKWNTGERTPTFAQVELVSKKTNIPFGYFFLNNPPQEKCELVDYRTIDSISIQNPSQNLLDTIKNMTEIQDWMVEYLNDNGYGELDYVGSYSINDGIKDIAKCIRGLLGIEIDWYKNSRNIADSFRTIKKACQRCGIVIMMNGVVGTNTHRKLDVREFRAFTLVNKHVPLVFINTCDSEAGKLFSIFHEIAHIVLGKNSLYNDSQSGSEGVSRLETICNAVAAEILLPITNFEESWNELNMSDENRIYFIAQSYKCSRYVVARRALDSGKISKQVYNSIIKQIISYYEACAKSNNKSDGGNFYATMVSKFDPNVIMAMSRSAKEGKLQYTRMFRMTGTNRTTFDKIVTAIGGEL